MSDSSQEAILHLLHMCNRQPPLSSTSIESIRQLLADHPSVVNQMAIIGRHTVPVPALLVAVDNGHAEVVQMLLSAGTNHVNVSISAQNVTETPLSVALSVVSNRRNVEVVKMLISSKANVNSVFSDRRTPLHVACHTGFAHAVELLLENRADVRARCDAANVVALCCKKREC